MEFINKIELCGYIGHINVSNTQDKKVARFSLAIENAYKDAGGGVFVELSWFNCTAWEGKDIDLSKLEKGTMVHLTGRVKMQRYLSSSENERVTWEVQCKTLEVVNKP